MSNIPRLVFSNKIHIQKTIGIKRFQRLKRGYLCNNTMATSTISSLSSPILTNGHTNGTRSFSAGTQHKQPTNVGNAGFAEQDTVIGKQADEPLTVEGIKARRAKAGKLIAPTASYSDSDMFKSPVRLPLCSHPKLIQSHII